MVRYQFTQEQFCKVLADTLDMYLEYVDVHGHDRVRAAMAAIDETLQCPRCGKGISWTSEK